MTLPKGSKTKRFHGMLLAPGVALGRAFILLKNPPLGDQSRGQAPDIPREIAKLRASLEEVEKELSFLKDQVKAEAGAATGALLDVQLLIVGDVHFVGEIEAVIRKEPCTFEIAVNRVMLRYEEIFGKSRDAYLREKFLDVKDALTRMIGRTYLMERRHAFKDKINQILVADQILPTTLLGFQRKGLDGILTVTGGLGSHAAILARSYGLPALGVAKSALHRIHENDLLFIDGYSSSVYLEPGEEIQLKFKQEVQDYRNYHERINKDQHQPAKTKDGIEVKILANCGHLEDVRQAREKGADGIGLFRTEMMFHAHRQFPTEEEQYHYYKKMIEEMPDKEIVIRTLDLGGDKALPYFLLPRQVNPYLGWRSLKISFDHPHEFKCQIKAILRAACHGDVKILFPMVTNYSDIAKCKEFVAQCRDELEKEGKEFRPDVPLGAMLETPSAVLCFEAIAEEADFLSVGTNDLIQHILAVDRDNPRVSEFYVAHHPAVIMTLRDLFQKAKAFGKSFTLCGEMASKAVYNPLLLGLGLRHFSMAPAFLAMSKDVIRHLHLPEAEAMAARALQEKVSEKILNDLKTEMERIYPDLCRIG